MSGPPEQFVRYVSKPHFQYMGRVWSCTDVISVSPFSDRIRTGYGWTVRQAWDDWRAQA